MAGSFAQLHLKPLHLARLAAPVVLQHRHVAALFQVAEPSAALSPRPEVLGRVELLPRTAAQVCDDSLLLYRDILDCDVPERLGWARLLDGWRRRLFDPDLQLRLPRGRVASKLRWEPLSDVRSRKGRCLTGRAGRSGGLVPWADLLHGCWTRIDDALEGRQLTFIDFHDDVRVHAARQEILYCQVVGSLVVEIAQVRRCPRCRPPGRHLNARSLLRPDRTRLLVSAPAAGGRRLRARRGVRDIDVPPGAFWGPLHRSRVEASCRIGHHQARMVELARPLVRVGGSPQLPRHRRVPIVNAVQDRHMLALVHVTHPHRGLVVGHVSFTFLRESNVLRAQDEPGLRRRRCGRLWRSPH